MHMSRVQGLWIDSTLVINHVKKKIQCVWQEI